MWLDSRNGSVFSEQFSEWLSRPNLCENPILGATLGATLGIGCAPKFRDAAFLLTIGSFLLTAELFYLQLTILGFFTYSWSFFAYSFSFFTYSWSFLAYSFSFVTYSWSFLAYSGKVRLIRALRDCKQRSLTVSKKTPTVSKKSFSPKFRPKFSERSFQNWGGPRPPEMLTSFFWGGGGEGRGFWGFCRVTLGECKPECTKPSHSHSLANFVANFHSQGISAARTKFSHFINSQKHSHSLANSFATLNSQLFL